MRRIRPIENAPAAIAAIVQSDIPHEFRQGRLIAKSNADCEFPVIFTDEYRYPDMENAPGTYPTFIERHVRCRKCANCRKAKARMWAHRCRFELLAAPRTWFVTLTYDQAERQRVINTARVAVARHRITPDKNTLPVHAVPSDFDALPINQQFAELAKVTARDATLWLKTVRKGRKNHAIVSLRDPIKYRYILVTEPHQDGFPHFHLLMNEIKGFPLTERRIRRFWNQGKITEAKLVPIMDPSVPWYVCKYINKAGLARVRASHKYGLPRPDTPFRRMSKPASDNF